MVAMASRMFGSCNRTQRSRGSCGAALTVRSKIVAASDSEAARKNTHVISTAWNVTIACSGRANVPGDRTPGRRRHTVVATT